MADEYGRTPYHRDVGVPTDYAWAKLKPLKGAELETHYVKTLRELGTAQGILGQIFTKAQNKIQDPAKLIRQATLSATLQRSYEARQKEIDAKAPC